MTIKLKLNQSDWFYIESKSVSTQLIEIEKYKQPESSKPIRCIWCDGFIQEEAEDYPYIKLIYTDDDILEVHNCFGYILNDKGQTIERL